MKPLIIALLIGFSAPLYAAENDLDVLQGDLRKQLDNVLTFWTSPKLLDADKQGFRNLTASDGNPLERGSETTISHLQILYVYATTLKWGLRPVSKETTSTYGEQLKYMADTLWDKENGGWLYKPGQPQKDPDGRLRTITNVYALYVLSELYGAANDLSALGLADKTFEYLRKQWDEKNAGYFTNRDNPKEKDAWINSMAMLALAKYARAAYSDDARNKAISLYKIISRKFLNPTTGHGYLSFDSQWKPKAAGTNGASEAVAYGRSMEILWSMIEAGTTLGIDSAEIRPWLEKGAGAILKDAVSASGAVFVSTDAKSAKKVQFWGQAEAMNLLFRMYALTRKQHYLDAANRVKSWTFKHVATPKGFWRPLVNQDGSAAEGNFADAEWRGGFHETRMLVNVLDAIDEIQCSKLPLPYPGRKLSLTGSFLIPRAKGFRDYEWTKKHLLMMKDVGMDLVIIMWLGYPGKANDPNTIHTYYASEMFKQFPGFTKENDPFRNIFQAAEELDMKVMSAAEPNGGNRTVDKDKEISAEIWKLYGKYKSFYGWYFANEYSDRFWVSDKFLEEKGTYYGEMVEHLHRISGKPVAFAPYVSDAGPEKQTAIWDRVFKKTKIDIMMLQDGIGCLPVRQKNLHRAKRYYHAIEKACKANGVEFWSDLEVFSMDPLNVYKLDPGNCFRVIDQIEAEEPLVEKIVIYQFSEIMAPPEASLVNSKAARDLYENYRTYFLKKNKLSPDLAIDSLKVLPKQQGPAQVEVTVKNVGNHQIGQTIELAIYDSVPDSGAKPVEEKSIPWLRAGETEAVVFTLPKPMKKVFAVVDPKNNLSCEASKKNNVAERDIGK